MTLFESKLCDLLSRCEKLLVPVTITREKWQIQSETQMQTVNFVDEAFSIQMAFAKNEQVIKALSEYSEAEDLYNRDRIFLMAPTTAGHWGQFRTFLASVLQHSARIARDNIAVDYTRATAYAKDFRRLLGRKLVTFEASARLFGVAMTQKIVELPDGVTLHRLTRKERNDRMPAIEAYWSIGTVDYNQLAHSKCEMRMNLSVPADPDQGQAHFQAHNEALRLARKVFETIEGAILAVTSGRVLLGDIELSGGVPGIQIGRPIRSEILPQIGVNIKKADTPNIRVAHTLIAGGSRTDKILQRSIHRFILGRKRRDYADRLVDYVVAWESLLLTSAGSAISQEMSYRFALNGASLLSRAQKEIDALELNAKLKKCYVVRSKIVHGGTEDAINTALSAGGFNSLVDMCNFLESQYRCAIFWLYSTPKNSRPYLKQAGWEKLIWQ